MFGQVLDKLATWFSPSFLLSSFFPWLVFSVTNLVTVYAAFPTTRPTIDRYVTGDPGEKAVFLLVALGVIAVAAYVTAPMMQAMTEVLEGRYLPPWLARLLTIGQADHLARLDHAKNLLLDERQRLRRLNRSSGDALREARVAGIKLRHNMAIEKIRAATKLFEQLEERRRRNEIIPSTELGLAIEQLKDALANNCAEENLLLSSQHEDDPLFSKRLDHMFKVTIEQLLDYAVEIVSQQHAAAYLDRLRQFAAAELAPTRLGNDAAALRSYCESRYGFDFAFFWPRLQLALQKDEKRSAAIVNAKVQLDFAVLLLWLTGFFTGSWLVIFALWGDSLALLLIVAGVGPQGCSVLWLGARRPSLSAGYVA
jgi:hypothetical protein